MPDIFIETLRSWQNYYFMAGGASAALLGLMFVALSMGMHLADHAPAEVFHAFVTPSITYFVSVILISCIMLVPAFTAPIMAVIIVAGALFGFAKTVRPIRLLIAAARKHQDFTLGDWLAQVILPLVSYSLILLAGAGFGINQWSMAFIGMWLASVFLLICGIANTWGVVIWIVDHRAP